MSAKRFGSATLNIGPLPSGRRVVAEKMIIHGCVREWPSTGLEEAPWLSRQNQQDLLDCLRDVLILGDRLDVDQVRAAIAMLESKLR